MIYPLLPFPVTLSDPWPRFQSHRVIGLINAFDILCAQLTHDLFVIAKFLLLLIRIHMWIPDHISILFTVAEIWDFFTISQTETWQNDWRQQAVNPQRFGSDPEDIWERYLGAIRIRINLDSNPVSLSFDVWTVLIWCLDVFVVLLLISCTIVCFMHICCLILRHCEYK